MDKKTLSFAAIALLVIAAAALFFYSTAKEPAPAAQAPAPAVASFEDCAAAGNPVMESYPRQCTAAGKTFTENVEDEPGAYDEYEDFSNDEEVYSENEGEYYKEEYYEDNYYEGNDDVYPEYQGEE